MSRESQRCEYCDEFEERLRAPEIDRHLGARSRLLAVGQVLVFPSVSPLAVGHTLIAPRRHALSLRLSTIAERSDILCVVQRLADGHTHDDPLFFFEHGVGLSQSCGCGIIHAHGHALPLPSDIAMSVLEQLASLLPRVAQGAWPNVLAELPADLTYVSFGTIDNQTVFLGDNAGSQLVRRLVAAELRKPWDWREFSGWCEFDASLARLGSSLDTVT